MSNKGRATVTFVALVVAFVAFGGWPELSRLVGWGHREPPFVDHGLSDDEAFLERPPLALPIRPIDYIRFPRAGFGFVLGVSTGFQVDTFRGTATKDLVSDPDTTITLRLSKAEMDTVYQTMIAMRFFDLRKPLYDEESMAQPSFRTTLEARAGLAANHLEWASYDRRPSDEWKRLFRLVRMIENMVWRKPEWNALPEPRGGYQ